MSLLNAANANASAPFEMDDETAPAAATPTTAAAPAAAPAQAPAAAPAASTNTAVAQAAPRALAMANGIASANVLEGFKNLMQVDYGMLPGVIATNGNFVNRENKAMILGDEVQFELLSWQDSYTISANDDKAPKDTLRFSNDGVTCTDGTPVQAHIDYLRSINWPKAGMKQRVIVVAAIISTSKKQLEGELVQFDLSPMSRTQWMRLQANTAFKIKIGKLKPQLAAYIKATATLVTMGQNTFTQANFDTIDPAISQGWADAAAAAAAGV